MDEEMLEYPVFILLVWIKPFPLFFSMAASWMLRSYELRILPELMLEFRFLKHLYVDVAEADNHNYKVTGNMGFNKGETLWWGLIRETYWKTLGNFVKQWLTNYLNKI